MLPSRGSASPLSPLQHLTRCESKDEKEVEDSVGDES